MHPQSSGCIMFSGLSVHRRCFRAFSWERMGVMALNSASCCVLSSSRLILVTLWRFSSFLVPFNVVKPVEFEVSWYFLEKAWEEWPGLWHFDVSWPPQDRLDYGHGLLIFLILVPFWLSVTGKIWVFRAFPGECMGEIACNSACWYILTTAKSDWVLVMATNFGAILI